MATTERITTAEQLFYTPNLGRCELVRGELIMMSPAGARHGAIIVRITAKLFAFVEQHRLGTVYSADTGFYIERDRDTVRSPDVAFVTAARAGDQPGKGFFPGPPDLAVEVLSPTDRPGEVADKVQNWLETGCRHVWVVDPDAKTVTDHQSSALPQVVGIDGQLDGGDLLPGFTLKVAEVLT
jgi:Uma2 family endonuclease